jgi:transcriptional regulator with XRE-family HTH domain
MPKGDGYDLLYEVLGARIAGVRNDIGISQGKLAEKVGLSRVSIVNIEHGRQRPPLHLVWQIANVLGIEATSLIPLRQDLDDQEVSVQLDPQLVHYIEQKAEDDPTTKRLLTAFIQRVTPKIVSQEGDNR